LHPFGVAEIGRQDEHNIAAFIDCLFQGPDPVVTPSNGLNVKETADAIANQPTIQFFDKLLVLTAMTEEDIMRGRGHWSILPLDITIHDSNRALSMITLEMKHEATACHHSVKPC
jgi:hypothetical protein